jgi:hypothetical protein
MTKQEPYVYLKAHKDFFERVSQDDGGTLVGDEGSRVIYSCSDGIIVAFQMRTLEGVRTMMHKFRGEPAVASLGEDPLEGWKANQGSKSIDEVLADICSVDPGFTAAKDVVDVDLLGNDGKFITVTHVPRSWVTSKVGTLPVLTRPWLLPCLDGALLAILAGSLDTDSSVTIRITKVELEDILKEGLTKGPKSTDEMIQPFTELFTNSLINAQPSKRWVSHSKKNNKVH